MKIAHARIVGGCCNFCSNPKKY